MNVNWAAVGWVAYLAQWIVFFAALFFVPRNRKPSSATAWLMLIFLVPFLGLLIFLVLGSPKLSPRRRAQQRTADEAVGKVVAQAKQDPNLAPVFAPTIPARYEPFVRLNANLGGMPAFGGNTVTLLPDYDGAIIGIAQAIEKAERYVHVEYFILAMDTTTEPVFVAMENAVKRGVKVRVLLDHLGSVSYPGRKDMIARMDAAGIDWHWMLKVGGVGDKWNRPDLRNHRKIVVVDGVAGFTGSQNMIDKTYLVAANLKRGLYYIELVAHVTGPVVAQLDAVFRTDWYAETHEVLSRETDPRLAATFAATGDVLCQVLPSGSGYDNDNNLKLFTSLIHAAQHKLTITNPYFVPDDSLMTAVTGAAQRDVDVTFITSTIADQFLVAHAQSSFYEELLRAGVKIQRYHPPVVLHAKHMTIDDDIAIIGSSNLDLRSFTLNMEVSLVVYDTRVVAALQEVEAGYLRNATPLRLHEWKERPQSSKLFDNLARLTAALQ